MVIPDKLKKGDIVRIIAPARSMALPWINDSIIHEAQSKLESLGLKVTFGKNVMEINELNSSSIKSRVEDLHDAFRDKKVKMIMTIMGGFNSIELLSSLDYDLIKKNPKILCGYSDITALENAIYAKTGLITYSGPHFFDFGEIKGFDYTLEYFKKCLMQKDSFEIKPSEKWSNDRWGKDQENRNFNTNEGIYVINKGNFEGTVVGGNLITFNSLLGTEFRPLFDNAVLFIEDDADESILTLNRNLTSLTLQPDFLKVQGIFFGRFQPESKITKKDIKLIVENNEYLKKLPIIGGLDFGHTTPKITFPIGGKIQVAVGKNIKLTIIEH
jgi:muramoyltetrapeptide carboxypeptidase